MADKVKETIEIIVRRTYPDGQSAHAKKIIAGWALDDTRDPGVFLMNWIGVAREKARQIAKENGKKS